MYQIVIADDNPLIRMGLKNMIDWKKFHAQLAGEAKNGEEALALLEQKRPDLLITDIRMPGKDGLYLLKEVKECYPKTDTIVISAYDEFEYAKQALRAGSTDYILKPINPKELNASIQHAFDAKMNCLGFQNIPTEQTGKQSLIAFKCREELSVSEISALLSEYDDLNITNKNGIFCIICPGGEKQNEAICKKLQNKLSDSILMGSAEIGDYANVEDAWIGALSKAADSLLTKETNVQGEEIRSMLPSEDTIILLCKSGNSEKVCAICHEMIAASVRQSGGSYDCFLQNINRFLCILLLVEEKDYQHIKTIMEHLDHQKRELYYFSAAEIERDIQEAVEAICGTYQRMSGNKQDLVLKVKELIEKNYQQDISLAMLAQLFYVSQPYLSKIFKQETGTNLNAYITEVRMQKAKYLLEETDKKVFEIAHMVGYEDANYFAKVYKKYTGILPSDYR